MNDPVLQGVVVPSALGWGPMLLLVLLAAGGVVLVAGVAYVLISLPHRRLERARFFLDLIASGLARGKKPEHTICELARLRDPELGSRYDRLAASLERGVGLDVALEGVPSMAPPPVRAALRAGIEAGRVAEAVTAGRAMLQDGPAQTQHLLHYLIVLATGLSPSLLAVPLLLQIFVVPKFRLLLEDMGEGLIGPPDLRYLQWAIVLGGILVTLNAVIVLGVLLHVGGPRVRRWLDRWLLPLPDFLAFAVPWKRRRMLRDFTGTLAVLLDARLPEARALELAAGTTANFYYQRRAQRGVAVLQEGRGLVVALEGFDPSGELRWRIANAVRGGQTFVDALRGWREALDARAFREEQSAAHVITSALVLLNGILVALVVVSLFGMLVQLLDAAILW